MSGNEAARVLHAEPSLGHGFGKIAELPDNRKARADAAPAAAPGRCRAKPRWPSRPARRRHAAGQPGPGLARAPARRQARPAERAADGVSADIGRPDDGENPQQCGPAGRTVARQPQADRRTAAPPRARRRPSIGARHPALRRAVHNTRPAPSRAMPIASPAAASAAAATAARTTPTSTIPVVRRIARRGTAGPIPMPSPRRRAPSAAEARASRTRPRRPEAAPAPAPTRSAATAGSADLRKKTIRRWAHGQRPCPGMTGQREPTEAP